MPAQPCRNAVALTNTTVITFSGGDLQVHYRAVPSQHVSSVGIIRFILQVSELRHRSVESV